MRRSLPPAGSLEADELLAAFAAVEEAVAPVPEAAFAALADPARRRQLAELAARAGRVLVETSGGWVTGYDDVVADALVERGLGVLDAQDRAVVALVLIHTVVVPRARGQVQGHDWRDAIGTDVETL